MSMHDAVEEQIAGWRAYPRRRRAIHASDVEELEGRLRDQMAALGEAGLAADEAFLVAVKRLGDVDPVSREFARGHAERLWKQPRPARQPGLVAVAVRAVPRRAVERWQTAYLPVCAAWAAFVVVVFPPLFGFA